MKIAFVVPYVPNQIRTRSYNFIIHLSNLGHEVDVFTVGTGKNDLADAESLKSKCRNVYYYHQPLWRSLLNSARAVISDKPLQSVYSLQYELVERLKTIFMNWKNDRAYDVVHVEHLRGSEYGVFLKSHFPELPVVWDSVDCISYLFRQAASQNRGLFGRFMTRFELGRTQRAEAKLLNIFDHVLVTSAADKTALLDTIVNGTKPASITVLSNGVDQSYFKPNPSITPEPDTLIFSGKMSYHANISMVMYLVTEIMPIVWNHRPGVRLLIVGKDPSREIKKLAEHPLIHVTGTVEDIRPFLWKAMVAVAPLVYGAGVQNKILEAMAVGTPVITTSKAVQSLGVIPGREVLIGDTPADFSAAVLHLLENPEVRCAIGEADRTHVQKHHDWNEIAQKLVQVYSHLDVPADANFST
ncbi:MAG: glycosyltransferase [Chloroflexota bacterium]